VNRVFIAVNPAPKDSGAEISKALEASPTSNWAIVAAIIIAAMPHLWSWLGGHTKARNNLTETLLQKLSDSYQVASVSNESFRTMIENIAERPTELAENNAVALRDVQGELADVRGQLLQIQKKLDFISRNITTQAQNK
jgi:septation ring formation regulator EzrA